MTTPILLLHGALGSSAQLNPLKSILEKEGRKVFSLNFSGHGGEPFATDGFGIETFAQDVLRFIDQHQLPKVDIFGYSMGGYVALWLAHENPHRIRKIITLGTKFDWSMESAAKEVKKLNPEKIVEKVPAFARILEHRHAPNDWKELLARTSAMMILLGKGPLLTEELFKTLQTPALICLGDEDDIAERNYTEHITGLLPHGRFSLFETTPHPIEKVRLESLQHAILDFSLH